MNQYIVQVAPVIQELEEVKAWLLHEYEKSKEGFYCNWANIESCFSKQAMATISKSKGGVIGFATWLDCDIYIYVYIVEIHPGYRNSGVGKFFMDALCDYFRENGKVAITLECVPESSEMIWRKMGFITFIENQDLEIPKLYKPLIEVLPITMANSENEVIELWDVEPYQSKNTQPKWQWDVVYSKRSKQLLLPIIIPVDWDWQIRWRRGEETFMCDKVKYSRLAYQDNGDFLFIKEINDLKRS